MTIDKSGGAERIGNVRWLMVVLAFIIAAVAYLDRTNISITGSFIKRDFSLDNYQLGWVFSAFTFGYALTQPIAGRLSDRFGAYRIMAVGIFLWCILTVLTAAIPSHFAGAFVVLLLVRLALGAGESMLFPASNKLISNWIPTQERGLANGIVFAGVGVGSGITPPLITAVMLAYDWRAAFWFASGLGLVAMAVWLLLVRERPQMYRNIGAAELSHIKAGLTGTANKSAQERTFPWRAIIFNRDTALLNFAYFCFAYVAYIFFTWFFTYLSTVRGMDLKASGWYATLPFIAMAICSPLGGWIADGMTRIWGKRVGRCLFATFSMALAALFVAAATQVQDARLAVVVLAGGSGALYLAQSAFWALSADMGRGSAGSVSGLMNMCGQLGGTLVAAITPRLADYLGWEGSFLFTAGVALVGALAWLPINPDAQISVPATWRADKPAARQ